MGLDSGRVQRDVNMIVILYIEIRGLELQNYLYLCICVFLTHGKLPLAILHGISLNPVLFKNIAQVGSLQKSLFVYCICLRECLDDTLPGSCVHRKYWFVWSRISYSGDKCTPTDVFSVNGHRSQVWILAQN